MGFRRLSSVPRSDEWSSVEWSIEHADIKSIRRRPEVASDVIFGVDVVRTQFFHWAQCVEYSFFSFYRVPKISDRHTDKQRDIVQ